MESTQSQVHAVLQENGYSDGIEVPNHQYYVFEYHPQDIESYLYCNDIGLINILFQELGMVPIYSEHSIWGTEYFFIYPCTHTIQEE